MAAAEVAVSRDDLKKAENQVALQVHTLYFGILIAASAKAGGRTSRAPMLESICARARKTCAMAVPLK